jgi:hypothetical protein
MMIKILTYEQAKDIALDLKLPMCDCGCNRPSWRVMEFYWDIANAIKKLNESEKKDD